MTFGTLCGIARPDAKRRIGGERFREVVLALAGEVRDLLAAGEVGQVAGAAAPGLRQLAVPGGQGGVAGLGGRA